MAKRIKFALEMANGNKVRTLEELREHFDLKSVVGHFLDGKLVEWLEDRYHAVEAEKVSQLNATTGDFGKNLCDLFGVVYVEATVDVGSLEKVNRKRAQLTQLTADTEIIANAEKTAFFQEELVELITEGIETIYLCGEEFTISLENQNCCYVGILAQPLIHIDAESQKEIEDRNIKLLNIRFNKQLEAEKSIETETIIKGRATQRYRPSEQLALLMNKKDRIASEKLFDVTQEALKEIVFDIDISSRGMEKTAKESLRRINFDIDIWTEPLERAVKESNLRNGLERYLETL